MIDAATLWLHALGSVRRLMVQSISTEPWVSTGWPGTGSGDVVTVQPKAARESEETASMQRCLRNFFDEA